MSYLVLYTWRVMVTVQAKAACMEALISTFWSREWSPDATIPHHPSGHLWLSCLLLPALACALSFVNVVGECVFLHYRGQPPASCVIALKFPSPSLIYFVCLGVFYCFHPPLAQAVCHFTWWPCVEVHHKHARLIVVTMGWSPLGLQNLLIL